MLIFVIALIILYLLLTYSYAGYRPKFPEEKLHSDIYQGKGFRLETDSIADRAIRKTV